MNNTTQVDILYVDDDDVDVEAALRTFKKVNSLLNISSANNGTQALSKLSGEHPIHPKIILLDLNMPTMDGIEFLKILRNNSDYSDISVYVLTGAYTTKDKLEIESLNIQGHIIKPLQYSDALNVLWALESSHG